MKDLENIPNDFDNLEKYAPTLSRMAKQNPFVVPTYYFNELPDLIQNKIFLSETMQQDIPEGYFNELPNIIQSKIFLDSLNKENAFRVPEDYFEELSINIQSRVNLESLSKENPFLVPEGYFEKLPTLIQEKVITEKPAFTKVMADKKGPIIISLFRKKFAYVAAAASVALIISFSFFFNKQEIQTLKGSGLTAYAAPITGDDIKEYLRNNMDESMLMEFASIGKEDAKAEIKTEGIESNDVENYFNDNNVDVTEL